MPVNIRMIIVARTRRGASSALSAITLGSMPPMPMPVRKRIQMSSVSEPVAAEASEKTPMVKHEATIATRRPQRSPIQPNTGEPNRMPKSPALNAVPSATMLVSPHAFTRDGPAKATAPMS